MTTIVDSIRKHQKMIVLGVALAVITMYIIPLDQIASALTPGERVHNALQKVRDRIAGHQSLSDAQKTRIIGHLNEVEYRVLQHLNGA